MGAQGVRFLGRGALTGRVVVRCPSFLEAAPGGRQAGGLAVVLCARALRRVALWGGVVHQVVAVDGVETVPGGRGPDRGNGLVGVGVAPPVVAQGAAHVGSTSLRVVADSLQTCTHHAQGVLGDCPGAGCRAAPQGVGGGHRGEEAPGGLGCQCKPQTPGRALSSAPCKGLSWCCCRSMVLHYLLRAYRTPRGCDA